MPPVGPDAKDRRNLMVLRQDATRTPSELTGAVNPDADAEFAMTTVRRLPGTKAKQTAFILKEMKPASAWPHPDLL